MADVYENDLLKNSRSFSERVYFKKKDLYDSSVLIKLYLCMFGGEKGNLYQKNLKPDKVMMLILKSLLKLVVRDVRS